MNTIVLSEPIFAVIAWLAVLFFLKPKRIKELWPCGLLGAIVLFVTWLMLETLNLSWFIDGFLPIGGVPIFHLIWGIAGGILISSTLQKDFILKAAAVSAFTIISSAFGYVSEHITKDHAHNPVFTDIHNLVLDFVMISLFVWVAEGLFYNQIHPTSPELINKSNKSKR